MRIGLLLWLLSSYLSGQETMVIRNVTVLPMSGPRQMVDQTVMIENGRITFVGSGASAAIPLHAKVIDGRGKFLMPGLIDAYAHVHEENLDLFVAHGVTTVRNAPGMIYQLALRDAVKKGTILGPRIYSAGAPLASKPPVYHSQATLETEMEVAKAIEETKRLGYDAAFVYVTTSQDVYSRILDKSAAIDLPVQGHLPYRVQMEICATGGQSSFDNLVGLMNIQTGQTYPKQRLQEIGLALKKDGRVVIPTLTIHRVRAASGAPDSLAERAVMKYVVPRQRVYWDTPKLSFDYGGAAMIARTLYDQGVQLLIGTDAGFPFVVAGSSYADEVQNFKDLGIPDYEILQAATIRAAEFLHLDGEIGTIETGKYADLILLDRNPLENATHIRSLSGLCLQGWWYESSELRELLAQKLKTYSSAVPDRFIEFEKPPVNYRLKRHYEILFKGLTIGEEKLYESESKDHRMLSMNSIDPHCARKTTTEWSAQTVQFRRVGVEGLSKVRLEKADSILNVSGNVPYYGNLSWSDTIDCRAILGGPPTSINLDMDVIGAYQMLLRRSNHLSTGESDTMEVWRPEMNSEEWGREAIVGKTYYIVTRLDDESGCRAYRILQPGLNGHADFSFSSVVRLDKEGWIDSMNFNEKVNVRRKP